MNPDDLKKVMEQAQAMQSRMGEIQQELATRRYEASAGGGMVKATVSGAMRVLSIEIEPSLVTDGDRAMIQDLSAAAVNAALTKAQEGVGQELARVQQSMLGGIPGLGGQGS